MKNVGFFTGVIIMAVSLVWLFGSAGMMGMGAFGMMGGYPISLAFVSNPFAGLVTLGVWALIIGGMLIFGVWLVQSGRRLSQSALPHESALDTIKGQYARGEISKERFDALKQNREA